MREKLANLNQAYSIFIQEENQGEISEKSLPHDVKQFRPPRKTFLCDFCKNKRHVVSRCFKKHDYPPGWKKDNQNFQGKPSQINSTIGFDYLTAINSSICSTPELINSGCSTPLDLPNPNLAMINTKQLEQTAHILSKH